MPKAGLFIIDEKHLLGQLESWLKDVTHVLRNVKGDSLKVKRCAPCLCLLNSAKCADPQQFKPTICYSTLRERSFHFLGGGRGWKTFWQNNLALLLAEKIIWPSLFVEKIFLLWYVAKNIIYRIDRGTETAVYQAWLLKKIWFSILCEKKIWFQMVCENISSFNINRKKKSAEKKSSTPLPQIMKWSLPYTHCWKMVTWFTFTDVSTHTVAAPSRAHATLRATWRHAKAELRGPSLFTHKELCASVGSGHTTARSRRHSSKEW